MNPGHRLPVATIRENPFSFLPASHSSLPWCVSGSRIPKCNIGKYNEIRIRQQRLPSNNEDYGLNQSHGRSQRRFDVLFIKLAPSSTLPAGAPWILLSIISTDRSAGKLFVRQRLRASP